jgi:hypothetical protein
MNARYFFALVLSVVLHGSSAAADTAEKWIAKARGFLGSESALDAITSIHFTGTLDLNDVTGLPTEIIFQKPYRQRITVTSSKVIETTALDDYDAWKKRINAENPVHWQVILLDASQVKRLRANTLENLSFYSAKNLKGCVIEALGDVTLDGIPCVKISFTHSGGVFFMRYFEKATGRLIKTETEAGTEIREEGEIIVNGVRFPKRVINKGANGDITTISFDKVTVNETFPAETFAVPSLQTR